MRIPGGDRGRALEALKCTQGNGFLAPKNQGIERSRKDGLRWPNGDRGIVLQRLVTFSVARWTFPAAPFSRIVSQSRRCRIRLVAVRVIPRKPRLGCTRDGRTAGPPCLSSVKGQGDPRYPEKPGNLVFGARSDRQAIHSLVTRGTTNGAHLWPQLGHAGALSHAPISQPKGPSALNLEGLQCAGMSLGEVEDLPPMYARTAAFAKDAGFGGVHIHAGHGFLLSQFPVSPVQSSRRWLWRFDRSKMPDRAQGHRCGAACRRPVVSHRHQDQFDG